MSKLFSFFIFLYFIKLILGEKQDFKCGPLTNKLKIGDKVILCIHVLNSQHKKFAIPIKIDEYSVVSFNHIYKFIKDISNDNNYAHNTNNSDNIKENQNQIELIAQIGDKMTVFPTVSIKLNYNIIVL